MPDQPLDSELSLRGIIGVGAVLIATTAAVIALMWWMSLGLRARTTADDPAPAALPEARQQQPPTGPLLQADPIGELRRMRQEEEAILAHGEWLDETTLRLPIDMAIEIVAAKGRLPDLGPGPDAAEDGS